MKFGKLLKDGDQADRGALYVRYGALKKQLKIMTEQIYSDKGSNASIGSDAEVDELARQLQSTASAATPPQTDASAPNRDLTVEEAAFVATLNEDLAKLNDFFIDSEEDAVIRLAFLNQQIGKAKTASEKAALKTDFVDFHGELVLLQHWSMLNMTSIMKILKKHDKLTGHLLRGPFLENALHQPFYSTEGISRLVKEVEARVAALGTRTPTAAASASPVVTPERIPSPVDLSKESSSQADILRRTAMALSLWQELGEKASTPSTVLPPSQTIMGSPPKRQRVMPTSVPA